MQLPADHGAVISWVLPDGFTAFAEKTTYKKLWAKVNIGGQEVHLNARRATGKINKVKHKSAIAANFTHSWDSYVIRYVMNNFNSDSPVSSVHDALSCPSFYLHELRGSYEGSV